MDRRSGWSVDSTLRAPSLIRIHTLGIFSTCCAHVISQQLTLSLTEKLVSNADSWALPIPMLVNENSLGMLDAKLTVSPLNSARRL